MSCRRVNAFSAFSGLIAARRSGAEQLPMRHGVGQNELYPTLATVPESRTLTSWTVDQSVEYVRERRDPTAPFFLWCSFSKPHPPLDPPEPYYSMYQRSPLLAPVYGAWADDAHAPPVFRRERQGRNYDRLDEEVIRAARAAYYGLITQIDYNIGRLWGALREVGVDEHTLIVFASDHGEYLGDHWAGAKRYPHEPSAHVPMIVRPPQGWSATEPGHTDDRLVTLADLLPTFVHAAGGDARDVEGHDLLALLRDELAEPRQTVEMIAQMPEGCACLGITDGRWKYIWFPEGAVEQLFDLARDPHELTNLAADPKFENERCGMRDRLVERLHARGGDYLDENGELPERPVATISESQARAVNTLGLTTEYVDRDTRH